MTEERSRSKGVSEKVRLELRFDCEVADGIKKLADETGVSVNQLIQALVRWVLANHPHGGYEPYYDEGGLKERRVSGCMWWGEPDSYIDTLEDPRDPESRVIKREVKKGRITCALDFTERRVIQDKG